MAFLAARRECGYTQHQMAERLLMDQRSYGLLESGKTFCSALTLLLYLSFFCPDAEAFLRRVREQLLSIFKDKDPL